MRLRLQLAVFAVLTLVLPWAGWRYVLEMEQALRRGLEQSLVGSASTVAAAVDDAAAAAAVRLQAARQGEAVYAQRLARAPTIDGARDDWSSGIEAARTLTGGQRFWAGVHESNVFVFVEAADPDIVYQGPPGATPYGDRVLLSLTAADGARRWLLLATRAPGVFRAQRTGSPDFAPAGAFEDRVLAAWQETGAGFSVEARVPMAMTRAALGVAVIDSDPAGAGHSVAMSTSWHEDTEPGALLFESEALRSELARFTLPGERYRVVDRDGYVLSDVGRLGDAAGAAGAEDAGLVELLIRVILRGDDPEYEGLEGPPGKLADERLRAALAGETATAWYRRAPTQSAVVTAAVPLRAAGRIVGAVVLERTSEAILTVTDQALVRLVGLTALASGGAMIALLGYATFLSLRVRRLARAAEQALGPRGEVHAALPGRAAPDEIGDLARSFAGLLGRLGEYTDYQRTLTSKLAHELRTPAAIISTSLDNLEHELGTPRAPTYLERLRQGAHRLDAILAAMSEATRIEQAIRETEPRRFELADVVESCCAAYGDVYPERRFAFERAARSTAVTGSEDLIAQMLDKLVDNAVGFSGPGTTIGVRVARRGDEVGVTVRNSGSTLPEEIRGRLFDSLVSARSARDERPHLGLGLRIVALIAEFHDGRAGAENLPGGGVEVAVWMRHAAST